jgi:type IV pilus assembly protein PilB
LVTGPTGSGKTTTLYAVLKRIDPVERSVQSIENPIEYRHGLWQQYELRKDNQNEGEEYNKWLKALLRNAPDVILVGEVRDAKVAQILLDAANTGHLAFATLHTNNAAMALARLKALALDMNTLASVLVGILAQRLVRILCIRCCVPDDSDETAQALDVPYLADGTLNPHRAGDGCEYCDFTGYRGRRMVYEILEVDARVQTLIEKDSTPSTIARAGIAADRTMWACGLKLVASGATSLEELRRVAKPDNYKVKTDTTAEPVDES